MTLADYYFVGVSLRVDPGFKALELLAIEELPSDDAAEGLDPAEVFFGRLLFPSVVGFLGKGFLRSSEVPDVVADIEEVDAF